MSNVIQFTVETHEELELIELAEEVVDAINYHIKQVKQNDDADEYTNALRELRIIKEFYRLKEFTSHFYDKFL